MRIYLSVTDMSGKTKTFALGDLHTTVGRSKKSKVPISDDLCSGIHCKFYVENECVFVEDLGSKNGVFLNDIKVKKQRLYIGDEVRIGSSKIKIDHRKMSNAEAALHTPESTNRRNGSITLELETFAEVKSRNAKKTKAQKEYLKKSKLYEGVAEDTEKAQRNSKKLLLLEKLALIVDLLITFNLLLGPIIYFNKKNKAFMSLIMKDPSQIIVGENLIYTVAGLILAVFFFRWNRKREKGTIGEQIFGI